jgi:hypothetical protein
VDELWQKYRSFWVPVLYGVGAFLLGLIVVHMFTDDPEAGRSQNESRAKAISKKTAPSAAQIKGARENTEALKARTGRWAARLDQRHGDAEDPLEAYVVQALRAAILRGSATPDEARFDGDRTAAGQAAARYEQLLKDRLEILRTQDPNISFSRIRADVVQEILLRANRADVDLGPAIEEIGFTAAAIPSVDRAELPRRLANLALVATILDVAIREGIRSIDNITLLPTDPTLATQGPESFLLLWPVKVDVTGPAAAIAAVLNTLTDPERPTPLGTTVLKRSTQSKDGLVRAEIKAYSVRVQPDAPLGLEAEGGETPR